MKFSFFLLPVFVSGLSIASYQQKCEKLFAPMSYNQLNARDKIDYLYSQVQATEYGELPVSKQLSLTNFLKSLQIITTGKLGATFSHQNDFMPQGRIKMIHTYGSVGKVRFKSIHRKYTGLFQGADGLVRFSLAAPAEFGFIPGMAILFPVDGQPSQSIIAMESVDGQESRNFFEHDFSNRIPKAKGIGTRLGSLLFSFVKRNPTELELDAAASVSQNGKNIHRPVVPFKLIFRPSYEVNRSYDTRGDFRDSLAQIPPSTTLYEVFVLRHLHAHEEHIGSLELMSPLIASKFGDENLFFRHPR